MKITFIGTGDAYATPTRGNFGFLLPEEGILVDAPSDVMHKLKKINYPLDKLKYVLISHTHGDHALGLLFLFLHSKYFFKKQYKIIAGKGAKKLLTTAYNLFFPENDGKKSDLRVFEIKEGSYNFRGFSLKCLKTKHSKPNFCYKIKIKGKTIVYTGDTFDDVSSFAKGSDVFIGDSSLFDDKKIAKSVMHGTALRTIEIGKKAEAKSVVVSHISEDVEKHLNEIRKYAKKRGIKLFIPSDLETIEI
ncbi:MAG: MBL fold metallo-hydrolase [Candidatus Micrarchaeota archaeon]